MDRKDGPALPNTARQFELLRMGAKSMDLGSWEDEFDDAATAARNGTLQADTIVRLIDHDYTTDQNGRAALEQFVTALLADAMLRERERQP